MPRIPDEFSAQISHLARRRRGGSVLAAAVPCERARRSNSYLGTFTYAVTNAHVLEQAPRRVQSQYQDDGPCLTPTTTLDKFPIPDDIAACAVSSLDPSNFLFKTVGLDMFVTKQVMDNLAIGPGDDVFTVGRFINARRKAAQLPSVRFGNIAQMPWEPIRQSRAGGDRMQESWLVEARSVSGFSGSPVFALLLPSIKRPAETDYRPVNPIC